MVRVLIVVDEPETMLQLQYDLEAAGHQTVLAADADTALERLAAVAVDVVLLDVMMPVRDGWTVLEALQRRAEPPPAVIVSGRAGPVELELAARLGAVDAVVSPIGSLDLERAIARAVARAGPDGC
jgi:CheY-like chemotaxis protein